MADDLHAVARFLFEAGTLKQARRTGWWMADVRDPESVAEHAWRTLLIASIIARFEGAAPGRAALLAVWHDSKETRTGDVNYLGKKYSSSADPDPQEVTADQTAEMPEVLASAVRQWVSEYEVKDRAYSRAPHVTFPVSAQPRPAKLGVLPARKYWRGCSGAILTR